MQIWIPLINFSSFTIRASVLSILLLSFIIEFQSVCGFVSKSQIHAMKVHPLPNKKKLRRLPHIFSRVLELPFRSDAEVSIEESEDCFKFVAEMEEIGRDVRAQAIEIHPGITKVVVRLNGFVEFSLIDDLELDMWRFRLPDSTRPELARAEWVDGELIVVVPKGDGEEVWGDGDDGAYGEGMGNSRLVLVQ